MKTLLVFILSVFIFLLVGYFVYVSPPQNGTYPVEIQFNTGESVAVFTQSIQNQKIVKSGKILRMLLVVLGYDKNIKPNVYTFTDPLNVFLVAEKLGNDSSKARGIKVTIPEGSTNKEIVDIIGTLFPNQKEELRQLLENNEGYHFPDTYYFSVNASAEDMISILKKTFDQKTQQLQKDALTQNKKWTDVIILASLIEKEGKTKEERKIISGILQKRLSINMPLQVDATFLYTQGKGTADLSLSDLKSDDGYNTYIRSGLPVGPINNPGLETIEAVLYPELSPYLFYLHDSNGQIHYGRNFEEHKINKAKYLK